MDHSNFNASVIDIIDNIPVGVIILDQDGTIHYSNNAAMVILNIDLYDLVEKRFLDLVKDEKMRFALESLQTGITEQTIFEIHVEDRLVNVSTRNMESDRFGVGATMVILEDTSKFKELERIKTDFVSTLLHRLRTPLTTIKSSLSFLSQVDSVMVPGDLKEVIDMCHSETNRLVVFLNDLRDLFLIEAGLIDQAMEMALVPLEPVLEKALRTIKAEARDKNIQVVQNIEGSHAIVEGDAARLTQIFTNILVNAVTFSSENKTITVALADEEDCLRVSITDTGIGMAEEELETIFEKYYRADNQVTRNVIGYGLGLYIAKFFVEYMGGKIYAYSEAERGSQFDIVFPH